MGCARSAYACAFGRLGLVGLDGLGKRPNAVADISVSGWQGTETTRLGTVTAVRTDARSSSARNHGNSLSFGRLHRIVVREDISMHGSSAQVAPRLFRRRL